MRGLNGLLPFPDNLQLWYKDRYDSRIIRYHTNSLRDYFENITELPSGENGIITLIEAPLRVHKRRDNVNYEFRSPERFHSASIFGSMDMEKYEILIVGKIEQEVDEVKTYQTIEIFYNKWFNVLCSASNLPLSIKKQEGHISISELVKEKQVF